MRKKLRRMIGYNKKIVRFIFSPFIDLITFRFEIVEPTVTPEEARQLAKLIETWASQWQEQDI